MVCIAVDSPDNLYVAEHFVVTHNTIQTIKYIIDSNLYPAVHSQAEKRLIRISQKNHVLCTYIVAQNTIEEHVADILQRKQGEFNSVMDGGKGYDDFNLLQELMLRMRDDKLSKLT
jgi:SNF2 family DNA or RNA helicase